MSAITCYHRAPTQSTMNRHCKTTASVIRSVNELAIIPRLRDLSRSLLSSNVCTNAIMNKDAVDSHQLEAIFQQKRLLRSKIRKDLKNMDPIQRSQEGLSLYMYMFYRTRNVRFFIWVKMNKIFGHLMYKNVKELEMDRWFCSTKNF